MLTTDTFLTTVYVEVDAFCKTHLTLEQHPGPTASLARSEVITLVLLTQWRRFASECAFYYTARQLRCTFAHLTDWAQLNCLVRQHESGSSPASSTWLSGGFPRRRSTARLLRPARATAALHNFCV